MSEFGKVLSIQVAGDVEPRIVRAILTPQVFEPVDGLKSWCLDVEALSADAVFFERLVQLRSTACHLTFEHEGRLRYGKAYLQQVELRRDVITSAFLGTGELR